MSVFDIVVVSIASPIVVFTVVSLLMIVPVRLKLKRIVRVLDSIGELRKANQLEIDVDRYHRRSDFKMLRKFAKYGEKYYSYDIESTVLALRRAGQHVPSNLTQLDAIALISNARGRKVRIDEHDEWQQVVRHVVANPAEAPSIAHIVSTGVFDLERILVLNDAVSNGAAPSLVEGAL